MNGEPAEIGAADVVIVRLKHREENQEVTHILIQENVPRGEQERGGG